MTFTVETPAAGTLRVAGTVRLGKRTLRVGTARVATTRAGRLTATVRLSRAAVAALRRRALRPTFTPKAGGRTVTAKRTVRLARRR